MGLVLNNSGVFFTLILSTLTTVSGQTWYRPNNAGGEGQVTWVWHPVQVSSVFKQSKLSPGGPSYHFQTANVQEGSYHFGYNSETGRSYREETKNVNGKVTGSYGYVDPDGVVRITDYVADSQGFRSTSRESSAVSKESAVTFGSFDGMHIVGPVPRPFSTLFAL